MKICNLSLLLITLICLTACGTLENSDDLNNDSVSKNKIYSDETEKFFESIEKTQVGDLYLKNSPQKNKTSSEPKNSEYQRGDLKSLTKPHSLSVKEIKLKGSSQLKRELNQVLSFHCMKHRKRFSHESVCIEAVNNAIIHCEKNHQEVKPAFINCLKAKLKNI